MIRVKVCICKTRIPCGAQVNIDSQTRQLTHDSVLEQGAREDAFEAAQRRIESLMEKDSYQRFLRSSHYLRLAKSPSPHPSSRGGGDGMGDDCSPKPRSCGERRPTRGGVSGGGNGTKFGLMYVSGSGSEEETPTVESRALIESASVSASGTPSASHASNPTFQLVCKSEVQCKTMRKGFNSAGSFDSRTSVFRRSQPDPQPDPAEASKPTLSAASDELPQSQLSVCTIVDEDIPATGPQPSNFADPNLFPETDAANALLLAASEMAQGHTSNNQDAGRPHSQTSMNREQPEDEHDESNDLQVVATFVAELAV